MQGEVERHLWRNGDYVGLPRFRLMRGSRQVAERKGVVSMASNLAPAASTAKSIACATFDKSIKDAEELLTYFESMPKPPPQNAEVLKRAGLVMAMTAWETFVEDRVREEVMARLEGMDGSDFGRLVLARLESDLKRFHNPSAEKTRTLFLDYLQTDVTAAWQWQNYDSARVKLTLDELIAKRGEAVHRSRPVLSGVPPQPHLVRREDLVRAITFLKRLVEATDEALARECRAGDA